MENNWRQKLHLEPISGWLNDPNGLSYFQNHYHVYFQYSPDSAFGQGRKCWGHYQSEDLLSWEFTGIVLFPDISEDRSGVYSGCGFVKDDELYLFYTGNVKEDGDYDYITAGRGANVIVVTTKDGIHMSEKRVLLRNEDYPKDCSCHVRDPKVWEENGTYHMVLGARKLDDSGCVLFYTSDNLLDWKFDRELGMSDFGYMWECPDVFGIEGFRYLSISPQGLKSGTYEHQNVYSSGYFRYEEAMDESKRPDGEAPVGKDDSDETEDVAVLHDFEEWDYGFDFYAPQTFDAPDGRKILIGWMGIGDIPYSNPTAELGWQHCLTVPREITAASDGKLRQNPVREYENLRKAAKNFNSGDIVQVSLPFELVGEADFSSQQETTFQINILDDLLLGYKEGIVTLGFIGEGAGGGRTIRKAMLSELRNVRILADTSSLEIYFNDGEKVMSTRYYPKNTEVTLKIEHMFGKIYKLQELEIGNL